MGFMDRKNKMQHQYSVLHSLS